MTSADMSSPASNCPWRTGAAVLGIATVVGLFFAAQMFVSAAAFGHQADWWQCVYWGLGDWYEWALLWPVILGLARRLPLGSGNWRRGLALHVAAGLVLAVVHAGMCTLAEGLQAAWLSKPWSFGESFHRLVLGRFHFNFAVYALFIAGWHAMTFYRRSREREAQAARLAQQLAEAQLATLRMQLNPHFLFNSLNAVSSLMLKDVSGANRMLARLGDLLRLTLKGSDQQEVTLSQELAFIQRYLDVEQVRFGDRLKVQFDTAPETLAATVPNLVLQPLVENAMRHAVAPAAGPVRLSVRSLRNNGSLVLEVADSGAGAVKGVCDTSGNGIGLTNTRQRLRQLYGEAQELSLTHDGEGGTCARIVLPFRVTEKAGANTPPANGGLGE